MEELRYPDLDVEQFWKDNEEAMKDYCFNPNAKQVGFDIDVLSNGEEAVITELGLDIHPWTELTAEQAVDLRKRYNDKAEKIVGKRIIRETADDNQIFPKCNLHGVFFGGRYDLRDYVYWLHSDIDTPEKLAKQLDRTEEMLKNPRDYILPANWDVEAKRIFEETGKTMNPFWYGRSVRGPVTLAMSIYGIENTIFLMYEDEELAHRFFDDIEKVLFAYIHVFEEIAGPEYMKNCTCMYQFNDDNCCMLTPQLYEEYAFPVLEHVFAYTCPDRIRNCRYQHSDSAMAHLIPVLSKLDFTAVQFGPTVTVEQIRKYMPNTRIDGCISPMTLMSNDEEKIIAEVRRDCEMLKATGTRGLKVDAAGSVNYGTKLTSIRAAMYAVQKYGRFD